ncbi:MAG: non-hydrolyzing UDP-N-acetylglucosamine 2-epimerase [Gaiellaceae bacterium]
MVGARPNYMKIAPVMRAIAAHGGADQFLVDTGQHYDHSLSEIFRDELELPEPYARLGVGSGTHAEQTAEIMRRLEPVIVDVRPDWVLVPGDVNSTLAAALTAVKLGVPVAHVEAGLRSRDLTMPEEINRIVVDRIAELLFTPSRDADENLRAEGIDDARIQFVGNVMIDSLAALLPRAEEAYSAFRNAHDLDDLFVLATLHRPANVDDPQTFQQIQSALEALAEDVDVVFPMHPRTRARAGASLRASGRLHILEPLGYLDFLALERHAAVVLTDSGGVQEETTWLGVPCLTVRKTTERPITVTQGTNALVAADTASLVAAMRSALAKERVAVPSLELWDGHTADRIASALLAR